MQKGRNGVLSEKEQGRKSLSRLAGPQTGLGRAPGRSCRVGGRPPNRPWPGSRPGASGGWPASWPAPGRVPGRWPRVGGRPPGRPRPGSRPAVLLVPVCRSMAGPLAGLGRSPGRRRLDGGQPPGRPRPSSRPATQFVHACGSSKRLVFVEGTYTPPSTSRQLPRPKEEHHHCLKASNR